MENQKVIKLFYRMLKVRVFEEKIAELYKEGKIKTDIYMSIGQEAVSAGITLAMKGKDKLFASHRNFATSICSEMDTEKIFREILGLSGGYNGGKGGPYYLADQEVGNYGSSFLPAGNVSQAVGMALSEKINGTSNVILSFIGEGAANEGIFHESLNLAANIEVPIVFVVENNEYSKAQSFTRTSTVSSIAARAASYSMPAIMVNGNNAIETYNAAQKASDYARAEGKPVMLEAKTYRFSGHHLGDNEPYRDKNEIESWYERCPVKILSNYMVASHIGSEDDLIMMKETIISEMDEVLGRVLRDYDSQDKPVYTMPKERAGEAPVESVPMSEKDVKSEKKKLRSYLKTKEKNSALTSSSILFGKDDDEEILVSGAKTGFPASLDDDETKKKSKKKSKSQEPELLTIDNYKTFVEEDDMNKEEDESLVDLESLLMEDSDSASGGEADDIHSNIMDFLKNGGE